MMDNRLLHKDFLKRIQKSADQTVAHLRAWEDRSKLVVALDGYSGVGKTTLLTRIAKRDPSVLPVHEDDFIRTGKERERFLAKAKDRSKVFELQWYRIAKIKQLINAFRRSKKRFSALQIYNAQTDRYDIPKRFDLSKRILLLEGVFLFHPKLFGGIWDKKIYLDAHIKAADRRRVRRERARWGESYIPESHPDSYARLFKIAHRRYRRLYHPGERADLVLRTWQRS